MASRNHLSFSPSALSGQQNASSTPSQPPPFQQQQHQVGSHQYVKGSLDGLMQEAFACVGGAKGALSKAEYKARRSEVKQQQQKNGNAKVQEQQRRQQQQQQQTKGRQQDNSGSDEDSSDSDAAENAGVRQLVASTNRTTNGKTKKMLIGSELLLAAVDNNTNNSSAIDGRSANASHKGEFSLTPTLEVYDYRKHQRKSAADDDASDNPSAAATDDDQAGTSAEVNNKMSSYNYSKFSKTATQTKKKTKREGGEDRDVKANASAAAAPPTAATTATNVASLAVDASPQHRGGDLTALLWDLIHSQIGFTRDELDALRQDPSLAPSGGGGKLTLTAEDVIVGDLPPNITDAKKTTGTATSPSDHLNVKDKGQTNGTIANSSSSLSSNTKRSLSWTAKEDIDAIRYALVEYFKALEALREDNTQRKARNFQTKSFVEDKRHDALKAREAELFVSSKKVARMLTKEIDLSDRNLDTVSSALLQFSNVEQLIISHNQIVTLNYLPEKLKILIANDNQLENILEPTVTEDDSDLVGERGVSLMPKSAPLSPRIAENLVFVSVVNNKLTDLGFVTMMPKLAVLDASFNYIAIIEDATEPIAEGLSPNLTELWLLGNPIALLPCYRQRFAELVSTAAPSALGNNGKNKNSTNNNQTALGSQKKTSSSSSSSGLIPQIQLLDGLPIDLVPILPNGSANNALTQGGMKGGGGGGGRSGSSGNVLTPSPPRASFAAAGGGGENADGSVVSPRSHIESPPFSGLLSSSLLSSGLSAGSSSSAAAAAAAGTAQTPAASSAFRFTTQAIGGLFNHPLYTATQIENMLARKAGSSSGGSTFVVGSSPSPPQQSFGAVTPLTPAKPDEVVLQLHLTRLKGAPTMALPSYVPPSEQEVRERLESAAANATNAEALNAMGNNNGTSAGVNAAAQIGIPPPSKNGGKGSIAGSNNRSPSTASPPPLGRGNSPAGGASASNNANAGGGNNNAANNNANNNGSGANSCDTSGVGGPFSATNGCRPIPMSTFSLLGISPHFSILGIGETEGSGPAIPPNSLSAAAMAKHGRGGGVFSAASGNTHNTDNTATIDGGVGADDALLPLAILVHECDTFIIPPPAPEALATTTTPGGKEKSGGVGGGGAKGKGVANTTAHHHTASSSSSTVANKGGALSATPASAPADASLSISMSGGNAVTVSGGGGAQQQQPFYNAAYESFVLGGGGAGEGVVVTPSSSPPPPQQQSTKDAKDAKEKEKENVAAASSAAAFAAAMAEEELFLNVSHTVSVPKELLAGDSVDTLLQPIELIVTVSNNINTTPSQPQFDAIFGGGGGGGKAKDVANNNSSNISPSEVLVTARPNATSSNSQQTAAAAAGRAEDRADDCGGAATLPSCLPYTRYLPPPPPPTEIIGSFLIDTAALVDPLKQLLGQNVSVRCGNATTGEWGAGVAEGADDEDLLLLEGGGGEVGLSLGSGRGDGVGHFSSSLPSSSAPSPAAGQTTGKAGGVSSSGANAQSSASSSSANSKGDKNAPAPPPPPAMPTNKVTAIVNSHLLQGVAAIAQCNATEAIAATLPSAVALSTGGGGGGFGGGADAAGNPRRSGSVARSTSNASLAPTSGINASASFSNAMGAGGGKRDGGGGANNGAMTPKSAAAAITANASAFAAAITAVHNNANSNNSSSALPPMALAAHQLMLSHATRAVCLDNIPLRIDPVFILRTEQRVLDLQASLDALVAADTQLNAVLAEMTEAIKGRAAGLSGSSMSNQLSPPSSPPQQGSGGGNNRGNTTARAGGGGGGGGPSSSSSGGGGGGLQRRSSITPAMAMQQQQLIAQAAASQAAAFQQMLATSNDPAHKALLKAQKEAGYRREAIVELKRWLYFDTRRLQKIKNIRVTLSGVVLLNPPTLPLIRESDFSEGGPLSGAATPLGALLAASGGSLIVNPHFNPITGITLPVAAVNEKGSGGGQQQSGAANLNMSLAMAGNPNGAINNGFLNGGGVPVASANVSPLTGLTPAAILSLLGTGGCFAASANAIGGAGGSGAVSDQQQQQQQQGGASGGAAASRPPKAK